MVVKSLQGRIYSTQKQIIVSQFIYMYLFKTYVLDTEE